MGDHVYRITGLVGSSKESIDDAIQTAVSRASQTLRNLCWCAVVQIRGQIEDGAVRHYQAVLKIGFTMEDRIKDEIKPYTRAYQGSLIDRQATVLRPYARRAIS